LNSPLNAWVEPSGDLLFYIGKSDSWEDNSRLAKVGLVRIRLAPALLAPGTAFCQELVTDRGTMVVTATPPNGGKPVTLRLWVDANHPVIHATVDSPSPVAATASFDLWRTKAEALSNIEVSDVNLDRSRPNKQARPTVVEPDTILNQLNEGIGWYHHNAKSQGPREAMEQQDLQGFPGWHDPILDRTFGALILSPGSRRLDDQHLESPSANQHRFDIHVLALQPASPDAWLAALRRQVAEVDPRPSPRGSVTTPPGGPLSGTAATSKSPPPHPPETPPLPPT